MTIQTFQNIYESGKPQKLTLDQILFEVGRERRSESALKMIRRALRESSLISTPNFQDMSPTRFLTLSTTQLVELCAARAPGSQFPATAESRDDGFPPLIREIKRRAEELHDQMDAALADGNKQIADNLYVSLGKVAEFRKKVAALADEWETLAAPLSNNEQEADDQTQPGHGPRLTKGLRTPQEDFRLPILEILTDMHGQGEVIAIREALSKKFANILRPVDFEKLSDGRTERWWNTAAWTRNSLKDEGFLKADSPHGVWEITDKGRAYLAGENARLPRQGDPPNSADAESSDQI